MLFPLYPHILMVKKPQLRPTPDLQCSASACSFASWKASNGRWTPRCFAVKLHKKTVSWATVTVSEHLHCYITRIYPWFFCKCTGLKYIIWLITYYIIQVYCIQNMKKMFTIYNLRMKISGKAWIFGMDCRCFNTGNAWCPFTSYHPYTNGLIWDHMGGS